jgi:hypothetical protein
MPEPFDLPGLLRPIEPDAFFRDTWEKQPLAVRRGEPGFYRGLFSLREVDNVIAFSRPKFLEPADFKPGPPAAHNFVQGNLADDQPYPREIYPGVTEVHQAFAGGKTVIITNLEHRVGAVAAMVRNLEAYFGCHVHANMYLTPKGAQGFKAHYDTHDVFVLQIEGSKHWRFYAPGPDLPLVDDPTPVARDRLGPPTLEATVQAGDLLYMPRGHIHEAFTSEVLSMHLTVGVKVFRWVDLLSRALARVSARDVAFRQALPTGTLTAGAVPASVRARFRDLLRLFAQGADADEAVESLGESFLRSLAVLPNDAFLAGEAADRLGPDTEVERCPGAIGRVFEGGGTSLVYPGNRLDGPAKIATALHFMARTPRFRVRDLPDDLTPEAKLLLVRRLVLDRFLNVVGPTSS